MCFISFDRLNCFARIPHFRFPDARSSVPHTGFAGIVPAAGCSAPRFSAPGCSPMLRSRMLRCSAPGCSDPGCSEIRLVDATRLARGAFSKLICRSIFLAVPKPLSYDPGCSDPGYPVTPGTE